MSKYNAGFSPQLILMNRSFSRFFVIIWFCFTAVIGSNETQFFILHFIYFPRFPICFGVTLQQKISRLHLPSGFAAQYIVLPGKDEKSTSSSCVFQMCELEVGMSLVKVMTNGVGESEHGLGLERPSHATWGANMPSMPADFTDPQLQCPRPPPAPGESHGPAQQHMCVCMCGRRGCVWVSEWVNY